jgi:hypothetical protein
LTFFVRNANIRLNNPRCYLPTAPKDAKQALMLTKDRIAELLQEQNTYLASQFGVRRIGLFGSASRNLSGDASDIDLVVEFERPIGLRFMELGDYLESLLGRKVDLLTPAGIQAIRSQAIRQEISESIVHV